MISLIICSRQPDIPQSLKENISETISVEYEMVIIDNSNNQYSLFQAYNRGVSLAKYPYLCFMHEDILYHTQDWGNNVIEHFRDEKVGLIGIGGCHYLSQYPVSLLSWKPAERNKFYSYNYIQRYDKNKKYKTDIFNNLYGNAVDVIAVDGMWFCMKRELFEYTSLKFDEENFSGFHFYDFDICMQIHALTMKIKVIPDILIEHFSVGTFNKVWYDNAFVFYKKWKDYFPIAVGLNLTEAEINNMEYDLVMEYIQSAVELQEDLQNQLQSISKSKRYRLGRFLLSSVRWLRK